MTYRVVVPKKARHELEKISNPWHSKILAAFAVIASDPHRGKKLHGTHAGEWSYRVWPYRILYSIKNRICTVLIIQIGHRKEMY